MVGRQSGGLSTAPEMHQPRWCYVLHRYGVRIDIVTTTTSSALADAEPTSKVLGFLRLLLLCYSQDCQLRILVTFEPAPFPAVEAAVLAPAALAISELSTSVTAQVGIDSTGQHPPLHTLPLRLHAPECLLHTRRRAHHISPGHHHFMSH